MKKPLWLLKRIKGVVRLDVLNTQFTQNLTSQTNGCHAHDLTCPQLYAKLGLDTERKIDRRQAVPLRGVAGRTFIIELIFRDIKNRRENLRQTITHRSAPLLLCVWTGPNVAPALKKRKPFPWCARHCTPDCALCNHPLDARWRNPWRMERRSGTGKADITREELRTASSPLPTLLVARQREPVSPETTLDKQEGKSPSNARHRHLARRRLWAFACNPQAVWRGNPGRFREAAPRRNRLKTCFA